MRDRVRACAKCRRPLRLARRRLAGGWLSADVAALCFACRRNYRCKACDGFRPLGRQDCEECESAVARFQAVWESLTPRCATRRPHPPGHLERLAERAGRGEPLFPREGLCATG